MGRTGGRTQPFALNGLREVPAAAQSDVRAERFDPSASLHRACRSAQDKQAQNRLCRRMDDSCARHCIIVSKHSDITAKRRGGQP